MQRGYCVFNGLCHRVNCGLFCKRLAANDGVDGGFNSGEVFVFVLVQRICLGDGRVNLAVIRALVLQRGYRVFDGLCHRVNFDLFRKRIAANDGVDSILHGGEVLVVVLVQCICLGDGRVNCAVIRGFARQRGRTAVLHKCVAQQLCYGSVFKFFCRFFRGAFRVILRSTFSIVAVFGDDLTLVVSGRISP